MLSVAVVPKGTPGPTEIAPTSVEVVEKWKPDDMHPSQLAVQFAGRVLFKRSNVEYTTSRLATVPEGQAVQYGGLADAAIPTGHCLHRCVVGSL